MHYFDFDHKSYKEKTFKIQILSNFNYIEAKTQIINISSLFRYIDPRHAKWQLAVIHFQTNYEIT